MKSFSVGRLWLLIGAASFADFVFGATFVYVLQHRGYSGGVIGLLLAIALLGSTLIEVPSGAWGDRYGQRRVTVLGLAAWGGGLILFGCDLGILGFGLGLLLWSAGMAIYSGSPSSLFIALLPEEGREERLSSAMRGGQIIRWSLSAAGALLVALAGDSMQPRQLILGVGVLLCLAALWVFSTWPETEPVNEDTSTWRTIARAGTAFRRPELLTTAVLSCAFSATLAIVILSWQPVALRYTTMGPRALGVALFVLTLAAAGGAAISSRIPESWAVRGIVSVLALANAVLLAVGHGAVASATGLLAAEFLCGVSGTLLFIRCQLLYPNSLRNTLSSLVSTISGVSMSLVDLVSGRLWSDLGIVAAVHWTCGTLFCLCLSVGFADLLVRDRNARSVRAEGV